MRKFIAALGLAILVIVGLNYSAEAGRLITGHDIKNGSITGRDLSPTLNAKISKHSASGQPGKDGAPGAQGEQGEPGDQASDVLGAGSLVFDSTGLIANIGGSFSQRATLFGEFDLDPGTYLLNTSGFFDRVDNGQPSSPQMQVAVRANGADYGTILTGNFPASGDREITASVAKVVTVSKHTTVKVYVFGYNNDGSSAGSGNYTANAQVSAVKIGVPQP